MNNEYYPLIEFAKAIQNQSNGYGMEFFWKGKNYRGIPHQSLQNGKLVKLVSIDQFSNLFPQKNEDIDCCFGELKVIECKRYAPNIVLITFE